MPWLQLWLQLEAFVVVRSSSPSFTAQLRRHTELQRTCANAIKINWQCGGQGFESPQLHPSEQGFLQLALSGLIPSSTSAAFIQLVRHDSLMPKSAAICLRCWPGSRLRATRTTSSRNSWDRAWARCASSQRHLSAPQLRCHLLVQQSQGRLTATRNRPKDE